MTPTGAARDKTSRLQANLTNCVSTEKYTQLPAETETAKSESTKTNGLLGPFQTALHSCAEPNSVRFDLGATLERQLIQTAYLCRT